MSRKTLAETLSGTREQIGRQHLHNSLDALLDRADVETGQLDLTEFFEFSSSLAQGRGIAKQIAEDAESLALQHGGPPPDNPDEKWAREQWAILFVLIRQLADFEDDLLPEDFWAAAFLLPALNVLRGPKRGIHMDPLGLGTTRKGDGPRQRLARYQLVRAVYFMAARENISLESARQKIMPDLPVRTWQDWQREVADAEGVAIHQIGKTAEAAARGEGNPFLYALTPEKIASLWKLGWRPR